jgi:hypothetical protein
MRSRPWGTIVSGLVISLTLTTAGSARAQFGLPGFPGYPSVGQSGLGYRDAPGVWAADNGPFGCAGCGGLGVIPVFPNAGYGARPQTTNSYQSVYDAVTAVPGWGGSGRRVRRRH